ncbi:peptidoglycan -binding protein [Cribrihabitans neustonicus]|uniref:peptidoglycan -binding protein n=1 Tax=Cribrihabitans neustonicus TaxID=1429085 RepID=UPI003B5C9B0B
MALSRRTGQRFQASIWPGFVDAMTGLLLVLMFVLTIFMVVQFVLRETITGQESELDSLSAEVSALAQALGLEERANRQLQARLGALTATLNTTQTDLEQARNRIAGLTAERDAQAAELEAAESRITRFEAEVAALISSRDAARAKISDLSAEREALETAQAELMSEQEALNLALAQARSEVDAQAEAARLAAARREALEALVAQLESEGDARAGEIASLEEQLSAEETARLAEAAAAEALREKLENADAELTAMTLALEVQRQEAEDTLTLLAAAEAAKKQLDAQLSELEAARAGSDAKADELAAELARTQAALAAAEAAAEADAGELDVLRRRLTAALGAQEEAETAAARQQSRADERAALLAKARETLAQEKTLSEEARRETALLNQQVAALRDQLGGLQAILNDYADRDAAQQVQLQNLGQDLNAALARAASEERKRRLLEEQERKRLEAEAERLAGRAQDLERYRSEFFGRLRDLLGNQEGVRIQGDRFVFASEVLFSPGSATLSAAGRREIAKVARILQSVAAAIPPEIDWVIRVDGHTDDQPLVAHPKFADNWELSQGRALSVVRYMVEQLGVPPGRLSANGFGEFQPVNPAGTPEARSQNRRIELKFTEK